MFLAQKVHSFSSKCFLPLKFVYRTAKMSNRKRYIVKKSPAINAWGIHLQVIGSGAADQPAIVALDGHDKCYLFNCGEGIGRHCQEAKIHLKKISNIFFTQSKWHCLGGVTSPIFTTVALDGYPPKFHGPKNLPTIIQRMIFLSSLGHLFKHRFTEETYFTTERFEDNKIVVQPISLHCGNETTMLYVCKVKERKGGFSLQKSVDKNVPAALLAKLFNGESITLNDGTVVEPVDVRFPDMPEVNMIFIDIPNQAFLKQLPNNKDFENILGETKATGIEVIIHFTPDKVFKSNDYQRFIDSIDAKRHLIVNDSNKYSTMERAHRLQNHLHTIDPKIHPLLSMQLDPNPPKICRPTDEHIDKTPALYTKYVFREQPNDYTVIKSEAQRYDDIANAEFDRVLVSQNGLHTQSAPLKLQNEQFPRILFLGTGSADSYLLRNSTGILVHLSKDHSILLDCGTAVCTQINRFYGDEAGEIYRRLKGVFISHMHLDHHIGLPELFRWRQIHLPAKREPLRVMCPAYDFRSWFGFYSNNLDSVQSDIKFLDNKCMVSSSMAAKELKYLNIESLKTCPVTHFRESYALAMTIPHKKDGKHDAFKIAYSGDTGPSDAFVELGQNADLLIHEATFADELREIANRFNHSTLSMAIQQAHDMHAKHTILTHFSSRFSVLPDIKDKLSKNMGIAFDFMEVQPNDLPHLHGLIAKYKKAFPETENSLAEKTKQFSIKLNDMMKPVEFQ